MVVKITEPMASIFYYHLVVMCDVLAWIQIFPSPRTSFHGEIDLAIAEGQGLLYISKSALLCLFFICALFY